MVLEWKPRRPAEYPDDRPYPSRRLLGFDGDRPIHVVAAFDPGEALCVVVTVYDPGLEQWEADFKTRRSK